jgi:hypothetical protein
LCKLPELRLFPGQQKLTQSPSAQRRFSTVRRFVEETKTRKIICLCLFYNGGSRKLQFIAKAALSLSTSLASDGKRFSCFLPDGSTHKSCHEVLRYISTIRSCMRSASLRLSPRPCLTNEPFSGFCTPFLRLWTIPVNDDC